MSREILDTWCERGILGLVLAILVYGPLATGAVRTPDFLVLQGLTLGVILLWGVRLWIKPRPQLLWPPICWVVLAFTVYAVGRYVTADIEYVARWEVARVIVYAVLFFAIVNNLHRQEHMRIITLTLVFLAMGIAFYAVYQFVTGSDRVWTFLKPYKNRGSGTFISPNNLAGFLEMILPLALAWVLVSRAKAVTRVFVGYAALVILAGIGVSISRGSWVATGVVLLILFGLLLFHRMYRLPAAVLLVLIVGVSLYFIPRTHFFKARFQEITANDRFNDNARFDLWKPAVEMWKENVLWGVGPNHYNQRFREYRPQTEQQQPDRVHNDYLNALTDWGIIGAALVAAAWAFLYAGVSRTWRAVRGTSADLGGGNSNKFAFVLGASLGLAAILLHSVVDFNMHIPSNAILAVTLMALLSGCLRFATDRYWMSARSVIRVATSVVLLAAFISLAWLEVRGAGEYLWLARANRAPANSPEQIAALQKAFEVEPMNFETAYAIGEALRVQSWERNDDYVETAESAIKWFDRSIELNPFHGYSYMRRGMCMDLLGNEDEAKTFFDKAVALDPNGYFTAAHMGWHYVQVGNYAAAKTWFERSKRLEWNGNQIADTYLPIVTRRLLEAATNNYSVGTSQVAH